ncbi:hypothetical protein [Bosea sp. Root670]|uniref:hypothetical protein n=1 Tax=Bosea sp. Root670 TaxID=1736583 RepID=UPI0012E3DF26|nr:hypothetical protein [Bosea sp. Root670]
MAISGSAEAWWVDEEAHLFVDDLGVPHRGIFARDGRKDCNSGVLETIKADQAVTLTSNPHLFRLLQRAHWGDYVKGDDVTDNFSLSNKLNSIRNNGRSYFIYRLHNKDHEVGVSPCGDIETVSLLKTMTITPKR